MNLSIGVVIKTIACGGVQVGEFHNNIKFYMNFAAYIISPVTKLHEHKNNKQFIQ